MGLLCTGHDSIADWRRVNVPEAVYSLPQTLRVHLRHSYTPLQHKAGSSYLCTQQGGEDKVLRLLK
jgi:hypothetical protein